MSKQLFILHVIGDVEPHVRGPYADDNERLKAAREVRHFEPGMQHDGLFRIDCETKPIIASFSGREMEI